MTLHLTIPDDLYRRVTELAELQQVSVDRFATAALAEQVMGWSNFVERAARGERTRFLAVLDKVAESEPLPGDELPSPRPSR